MSNRLQGKRIAFLMANEGVEQVELTEPLEAVVEAGGEADLLAPESGEVQAVNHFDKGDTFQAEGVDGVDAPAYDGLVLPGGVANPDLLRADPQAVDFVRSFFESGKPVGVICHGPWTLFAEGCARGAARENREEGRLTAVPDRKEQAMPPRGVKKGTKRARQYGEIKRSEMDQGRSESRAEEIAARTVNKARARSGESRSASRASTEDISSGRRGGRRSGTRRSKGRTREQLYSDARRLNVGGRSKMTKEQLQRAVAGKSSG